MVLRGGDVTLPPLERYLNWVYDTTPPPSRDHGKKELPPPPRDHGKENLPPPEEPHKLPRNMRPRRRQGKHQHRHLSQTGSQPGTSQSPSSVISTLVKHPQTFQRPQHPQPPGSAANHNSERPQLLDQAELGRLYKPARSSISKESTTRSRRDNISGSNLSFTGLQRSHRDYFSGSPSGQLSKTVLLTDRYREARIAGSTRSGPAQTPPRAALPDVHLEIGAALPEAAATCRIPRADHPPVVLDIPGSTMERPESLWRPESPRRGSRSPRQSNKRPRNRSSPSPPRPRKRPPTAGRWYEWLHRWISRKSSWQTSFPHSPQSAKDAPTASLVPLVSGPQGRKSRPPHPGCTLYIIPKGKE